MKPSEDAVLSLVRDRDYALTSLQAISTLLGRAIDRLRELEDDEGIEMLRAMLGEHFEMDE